MMKIVKSLTLPLSLTVIVLISICFLNSCQYEYSSPTPGTLKLKLHAQYNQFDTVFSANNLAVIITQIKAIRSDGIAAYIYQDPRAIFPTGADSGIYNIMGRSAYDSALVIGNYPVPPAEYIGIDMMIKPGSDIILDGYRDISVVQPAERITSLYMDTRFSIIEGKTTDIVITFNLDSVLQKLAYTFLYQPYTHDLMSAPFLAGISGEYFVPQVNSPATASGTFNFTRSQTRDKISLSYAISAEEDSADPFTAIHFYAVNSFDETGNIVHTISSSPAGGKTFSGTWSNLDAVQPLTPVYLNNLLEGKIYVSFLTALHPNGAIRGRLRPIVDSFVYKDFLHYYVTSIRTQ